MMMTTKPQWLIFDQWAKAGLCGLLAGAIIGVFAAFTHPELPQRRDLADAHPTQNAARPAANRQGVAEALTRLHSGKKLSARELAHLQNQIDAWLLEDPVECINCLKRFSAVGFVSLARLETAADAQMGGNFALAMKMGKSIDDHYLSAVFIKHVFDKKASVDPEAAYHALADIPPYRYLRGDLRGKLINDWIRKDPNAEIDAMLAEHPKNMHDLNQSFDLWAKFDQASAYRRCLETNALPIQTKLRILERILDPAAKNARDHYDRLRSLPESREKARLLNGEYAAFTAKSPAELLTRISEKNPHTFGMMKSFTKHIFDGLGDPNDPKETEDFFQSISSQKVRQVAFCYMALKETWSTFKDSDSPPPGIYSNLADWANQLGDTPERKVAIQTVVSRGFEQSTETSAEAIEYALNLSDESTRADFIHCTLDEIRNKMPKSGPPDPKSEDLEWIASLKPETKQALAAEIAASPQDDKLNQLLPLLQ